MKPIIESMLDDDLYKFTMQKVVLSEYPNVPVRYQFVCRNVDIQLGYLANKVRHQIDLLANLSLTQDERQFLGGLKFLKKEYIDFLSQFRYDPSLVRVSDKGGELVISIEGRWVDTILYEVKILSIVNELYFDQFDFALLENEGRSRLSEKIKALEKYPRLTFAEFGTRRRFSRKWQETVVRILHKSCPNMVGTSNLKLAMDLGLKPIGTMAHEYISAHLSLVHDIRNAQKRALHVWLQEYDNDLGIALSDTFTSDAFFRDMGDVLTRTFAGVRHDSGDPYDFGFKTIAHYKSHGVDPRIKTIVFSDGLDISKAIEIFNTFTGLIGVTFGIGTNLTNDLGITPLNIVIKMVECNGKNVVKLSDNPGKAIGDADMVERVRKAYN